MRVDDTIKLSTRMFKTNPARTWLTILGMGVGTSAVVALVGLGFGLQGILLEQIILGETLLSLNVRSPGSGVVTLNDEQLNDFRAIESVVDVSPLASMTGLITLNDVTGNVTVEGMRPTYFRYAGIVAEEGDVFREGEEEKDRDKIVFSKGTLKLFQIEDPNDVIGKSVKLRVFVKNAATGENQVVPLRRDYAVKGITNDAASIAVILPLDELAAQFPVSSYERAQVKVEKTDNLAPVQEEIVKRGFLVTTLSKTVDQANKIFGGIQVVLAVFGGIALVVSAIGMFNTMTVTLLERTGEIGIMRTIGASPRDIRVLFIAEAVVVGFLGGIVGMGIGVAAGIALNFLLNLAAAQFGGVAVQLFRYPLPFLGFITIFSAVVGFLTGVFPARRAAALSPLDAIRYK